MPMHTRHPGKIPFQSRCLRLGATNNKPYLLGSSGHLSASVLRPVFRFDRKRCCIWRPFPAAWYVVKCDAHEVMFTVLLHEPGLLNRVVDVITAMDVHV